MNAAMRRRAKLIPSGSCTPYAQTSIESIIIIIMVIIILVVAAVIVVLSKK